jgi:hypothetical protein
LSKDLTEELLAEPIECGAQEGQGSAEEME